MLVDSRDVRLPADRHASACLLDGALRIITRERRRRMIRCGACGAMNRVSPEKLAQGLAPRCGRCKAPLTAGAPAVDGRPITVADATFGAEVERSPVPVVVDIGAASSGPRR